MDGPSQNAASAFQPSLAVVIGVLCIMFFFTFILLVYAKFCHRRGSGDGDTNFALLQSGSRYSGIDQTVIQSLPFFRFSSLKGSKDGLECAVCLSKFEEIEVLRLLPKCKHAFHINCVDKWLEKHSSCPLCRTKVSAADPTVLTYSNSMRFLANQSELFIQREESRPNSSRFNGASFRLVEKAISIDEEALIEQEHEENVFDRFEHRIIVSDLGFNGRWSSVSASDLMFLSSELINDVSSYRFDSNSEKIMKIKEDLEMKRLFWGKISQNDDSNPSTSESGVVSGGDGRNIVNSGERRSVSEITGLPRIEKGGNFNKSKEERLRSIWLPIARNGVERFSSKEKSQRGKYDDDDDDDDDGIRHTLHV